MKLNRHIHISLMGALAVFAVTFVFSFSHILSVEGQTVPTAHSLKDGNWSDASVWDTVPDQNTNVVITHNVTIDTTAKAKEVDINSGTTTLNGTLEAWGSVVVNANFVSTQGSLLFHVADDRLFTGNTKPGPLATIPEFHPEDTGLWAMPNSRVKLAGAPVTSWLDATPKNVAATNLNFGGQSVQAIGGGTATLSAAPTGWRAGDKIMLTNIDGTYAIANLDSVSGSTITYSAPSIPGFTADAIKFEERTALPKIANLTRRVVVASADVKTGDVNHRAHTIAMHHASVQFDNVEFRDLGPRGKLGRYPVHFHHSGNVTALPFPTEIIGSSIWQDVDDAGNRLISVHDTQSITVKDNVGIRSQGHGYYYETGQEIKNSLIGNLAVDVRSPEELPSIDGTTNSYAYWLRTGNLSQNNVAIGGNWDAIAALGLKTVTGADVVANRGGYYTLAHRVNPAPAGLPANVDTGSQVFGCGGYGLTAQTSDFQFINSLVAKCGASAISVQRADNTVVTNPTFLYNGTGQTDASIKAYLTNIYVNLAANLQVTQGLIVGNEIIHTHYGESFHLSDVRMRSNHITHPTYWEFSGLIDGSGCDIKLSSGTNLAGTTINPFITVNPYPIRQFGPGFLRISGCTGQNGTKTYTTASPWNSTYTHTGFDSRYNLNGNPVPNGSIELTTALPQSGFIRLPSTFIPIKSTWKVVAAGNDASTMNELNIRETETLWQSSLATYLGYPSGFTPGTYDVYATDPAGAKQAWQNVVVKAGQITDVGTGQVIPQPSIDITKDVDRDTANPGDLITYTLVVTNTGNADATNVVISDTVPTGTTYAPVSSTHQTPLPDAPTVNGNVLSWTIGTLPAGQSKTITFQVTVD